MINTNPKYMKIIIFILCTIAILFGVYRCLLGVDIGDEALYISDPMFVAHGATPYVNNWLQTPGFSFFLAPVVALYELFIPTHEGIFLFMRVFFLVIKFIVYIGVGYLFRNTDYKNIVMVVGIPLICNFYGMIPSFNYTNIPLLGLLVAGMLLLYQWKLKEQEQPEKQFISYITGVILACITLCSPTQSLNCLAIMIFYYICVGKKAGRRYIAGGVATALFFSIYMIIRAGSPMGFVHSLETLLKHPYFSFGPSTLSWQAYQIFPLAVEGIIPYVVCLIIIELVRRLFIKKYTFLWSCKNGLVAGAFIGMIVLLGRYVQYPLWNRAIILLSIGSFFFRFISGNKGINKLFDFVAIPEMVTFLGMALTVYGGASNRFYVFVPMGLICFIYIYEALREQMGNKSFYLVAVYVVLFLVVTVKFELETIYGEFTDDGQFATVSMLTTRVEEGVYAGIYTTPEKAATLQELERYIRANTQKEEYVLFMDRVPMAYLMTEATHCAPTSWDPQLYSEGYRKKSSMLKDYFEKVKQTPDKIIYVKTSNDKGISIEASDYEFTQYVNQNYSLETETDIQNLYQVMIYTRK